MTVSSCEVDVVQATFTLRWLYPSPSWAALM